MRRLKLLEDQLYMRMDAKGRNFRRRSLYLHHAVKEVFLEETCVSVKQSELPLQAAAENHLFGLAVFSWGRAALSPSKMSFGIRELPVFHGWRSV